MDARARCAVNIKARHDYDKFLLSIIIYY